MLLTGRAVSGREAVEIGLASRLVPDGQALPAAQELARQMAAFPQTALRSDRQSAYRQNGLPVDQALAQETALAQAAREREAQPGARRFAAGRGRHGSFDDL
jgi:enoyl-CoA hydratase